MADAVRLAQVCTAIFSAPNNTQDQMRCRPLSVRKITPDLHFLRRGPLADGQNRLPSSKPSLVLPSYSGGANKLQTLGFGGLSVIWRCFDAQ
jgi:hypothetical protein